MQNFSREKVEGKKPVVETRRIGEDNIKVYLTERGREVDWIHLNQERFQYWAVTCMVIKLGFRGFGNNFETPLIKSVDSMVNSVFHSENQLDHII